MNIIYIYEDKVPNAGSFLCEGRFILRSEVNGGTLNLGVEIVRSCGSGDGSDGKENGESSGNSSTVALVNLLECWKYLIDVDAGPGITISGGLCLKVLLTVMKMIQVGETIHVQIWKNLG